jgi:16S rRNA (adenine1518-N6/adenine1519-N6)-dimethyltransferase
LLIERPKAVLERLGLSPRKALGQHFLVSGGIVNAILKANDLFAEDLVVEIGPGLGVVTRELVPLVRRVIAVEMDRELAAALETEFRGTDGLEVLCADARELDVAELVGGARYKLVANLPFYAAMPILRRFLESDCPPVSAVVMVQREVARNMVAGPGDMSLVSVGVQLYGRPRILRYVPPTAFYPSPKVTSAVVKIDVYPETALELDDREAFFRVVRAGFSAPRKQLRNSLAQGLDITGEAAAGLLVAAEIDPTSRAETLGLEQWGALYRQVERSTGSHSNVASEAGDAQ